MNLLREVSRGVPRRENGIELKIAKSLLLDLQLIDSYLESSFLLSHITKDEFRV